MTPHGTIPCEALLCGYLEWQDGQAGYGICVRNYRKTSGSLKEV